VAGSENNIPSTEILIGSYLSRVRFALTLLPGGGVAMPTEVREVFQERAASTTGAIALNSKVLYGKGYEMIVGSNHTCVYKTPQ
jgi:hypothetical protein